MPANEFDSATIRSLFIPTAAAVRTMRDETGNGMEQCKRYLVRQKMLQAVQAATSIDDLRAILMAMLVMPEI